MLQTSTKPLPHCMTYSAWLLSFLRPVPLHIPSLCAVQAVLSKLAALDADLSEKRAKKNRLESEVRMCSVKLDRAQKLISGLGGEKSRWTAAAALLGQQLQRLTGDVLLAAAQIAYLGEPSAVVLDAAVFARVLRAIGGSILPECFSSAPSTLRCRSLHISLQSRVS